MLTKIKSFFETYFIEESVGSVSISHQLNIAGAALLIEMVLQDDEINEQEVAVVKSSLITEFDLSQQEADELYQLAEEENHQSTDYHQFTKLIAEHYTQPQKIKLIESLWKIAFADNVLDKYEEHMLRRISDLIYVSHKDFIQAKHRVENEALNKA